MFCFIKVKMPYLCGLWRFANTYICNILRSEKKTVILVTHDISEAIAMTDRVLILTNRPASLLKTVDIKSRDTLSTQKYFDEIREVLK